MNMPFECLSVELILSIFEYFNTKEILQSFSNLNSFITSCIFSRCQLIHLYLDHEMSSLPDKYSPEQVISLHIKHVFTPIGTFVNLKSLFIVYEHGWENDCLHMIKEISKLSQLINLKLLLVGSEITSIYHDVIESALCHSSLQRIILSKNRSKSYVYVRRKDSSLKLIVAAPQLIYINSDPSDLNANFFHNRSNCDLSLSLTPQYHIQHLDINFNSWKLHLFARFLSALPSLITLKIKGFCSFNYVNGWFNIHRWDRILKNLPALQQIVIEICLAIPIRLRRQDVQMFNVSAKGRIQTCKRINLKATKRMEEPNMGCIQISAALNKR